MKQNKKQISRFTTFAIFGALLSTVVIGGFLYVTNIRAMGEAAATPAFSFNQAEASGWWSPGNYKTTDQGRNNPPRTDTGPLPVASMNTLEGIQGEPSSKCFITTMYFDGEVDAEAALATLEAGAVMGKETNYFLNKTDVLTQTMLTPDGQKQYQLHQYSLTVPAGEKVSTGIQFAFVPLEKGYVELRSYCETVSQLPLTIPALDAISLQ